MYRLLKPASLTAFLAIVTFLSYLLFRATLINRPQADLGGIEFTVIYHVQRLLAGFPLYTDPELSPYSINQYGPIFYYLVYGIGKLFNVHPDNVLQVFALNRTVALVFNILHMYIAYLFAKNIFDAPTRSSLAVAVFTFIFLESTSFSRPDSLVHVLILLSFLFFFVWLKKNEIKWLNICAVVCVFALFAKQNAIVVPAICISWLLIRRNYRALLQYTLYFSGALALALLIINQLWGLHIFFKNIVLGVNNGISLNWVFDFIIKPFFTSYGLLFLLLALIYWYITEKESSALIQFSRWLVAGVFVFTTLLTLKWGSWISYYTEWWTILFITAPLLWSRLSVQAKPVFSAFLWLPFIILLVKLALISYPIIYNNRQSTRNEELSYFLANKALADKLKSQVKEGDQIFMNTFRNNDFYVNLMYKQIVLPQFEIVYFTTYSRKIYDYSNFHKLFKTGKIKLLLLPDYETGVSLKDIDTSSYQLKDSVADFKIYEFVQ
jgi:hypothetical protein